MKMKIAVKMLAVLSSVMLCASVATAARPSVAVDCTLPPGTIGELQILCDDTLDSNTPADFKNQQDIDGLVGKVVNASFKMYQGKPCDADQKLNDYETKLSMLMLSQKPKISELKAGQLLTDLVAAQVAIAPLPCP